MSNNQTKTYTLAIITAIIIFAGGAYLYQRNDISKPADFSRGDIVLNFETSGKQTVKAAAPDATWQTYSSTNPAFTFRYPKEYTTGEFSEGAGKTVLIQGSSKTLTQIFVAPFADAPHITVEAITTDLPDLSVKEPQNIQVLGGSGLTFLSDNNLSEPTREVWFVRDGVMYQVSIPLGNEGLASNIIETMKFGK